MHFGHFCLTLVWVWSGKSYYGQYLPFQDWQPGRKKTDNIFANTQKPFYLLNGPRKAKLKYAIRELFKQAHKAR